MSCPDAYDALTSLLALHKHKGPVIDRAFVFMGA